MFIQLIKEKENGSNNCSQHTWRVNVCHSNGENVMRMVRTAKGLHVVTSSNTKEDKSLYNSSEANMLLSKRNHMGINNRNRKEEIIFDVIFICLSAAIMIQLVWSVING